MSNNLHKSAAVPFVNQRGERSMKRVKVPRYFAGKRPAYAKEEDEEEYVTDEEEEYDEENECNSDEEQDDEEEDEDDYRVATTSRKLDHLGANSDDDDDDEDGDSSSDKTKKNVHLNDIAGPTTSSHCADEDDEDEEDDPRFRRLKHIEAKADPDDLINVQRTQQIRSRYDLSGANVVLDEDDDEEEVRQRHAIARRRKLEEPLGPQAIFGLTAGNNQQLEAANEDDDGDEDTTRQAKRLDTEDILKDLKLTGISRPVRERQKTEEEQEAEARRLKDMLELAKQEAALTSQTYKKVEEDIRRDREKEALAKGDIGAREMSSALTDEEDDELAYEEWKFREIKRVQRDRRERMLLATARAR